MYLREMGSVELLSREGEIAIAKRIEAGRDTMIRGLCESALTFEASASCVVRARSSMSTRCAWRLPPAAPTVMNSVRLARAQTAIASLALAWSQASITASTPAGSSAGQFCGSTNSSMPLTSQSGLIVAMRSRMATTLAWPSVGSVAWIWRFMLDSAIWSRSIKVKRDTPLSARASALHEPTPPMPTTAT